MRKGSGPDGLHAIFIQRHYKEQCSSRDGSFSANAGLRDARYDCSEVVSADIDSGRGEGGGMWKFTAPKSRERCERAMGEEEEESEQKGGTE